MKRLLILSLLGASVLRAAEPETLAPAPLTAPAAVELSGVAATKEEPYEISALKVTLRPQFDSGQALLNKADLEAIEEVARGLQGRVLRLAVSGHTDLQRLAPQTKDRFGSNMGLSLARADAVKAALLQAMAKYGHALPEEVATTGEGPTRPLAPNTTAEGMTLNRRVELDLVLIHPTNKKGVRAHLEGSQVLESNDPAAEPICLLQTADPRGGDRILSLQLGQDPVTLGGGVEGAWFFLYSNYPDFFERYELILERGQGNPVRVLAGPAAELFQPLRWDLRDEAGRLIEPGGGYTYHLRVINSQGRADETAPRAFRVVGGLVVPGELPGRAGLLKEGEASLEAGARLDSMRTEQTDFDADQAVKREIPVEGALTTLSARFPAGTKVLVNGQSSRVDAQGRWVWRRLLKAGAHAFDIEAELPGGRLRSFKRQAEVDPFQFFSVGLADLTLGHRDVEAKVEAVGQEDRYPTGFYADGHLGFYLKGKIKGGWLLTAQADTGEEPLNKLFERLDRNDPQAPFRRLDPEAYYPVYGDASYTVVDVDTPGRLFIQLDHDRGSLRWGNIGVNWDAPVGSVQRNLYGAKAQGQLGSADSFNAGAELFAADDATGHGRDELRGTGGSLYYLSHAMVVYGSERLRAELREAGSGRVLASHPLEQGRDYNLDWLSGRVTLKQPLQSLVDAPSLIGAGLAPGDGAYLVAEYEYDSGFDPLNEGAGGARLWTAVGDKARLELRGASQDNGPGRHDLVAGSLSAELLKGLKTRLDLGSSRQQPSPARLSADGGLSFVPLSVTSDVWAGAYHLDLDADLDQLLNSQKGLSLGGWFDRRQAGFADAGRAALQDQQGFGLRGSALLGAGAKLDLGLSRQESGASTLMEESAAYALPLGEAWRAKAELKHRGAQDPGLEDLHSLAGALRLDWQLSEAYALYGRGQGTAWTAGGAPRDDHGALGLEAQLTRTLKGRAEVEAGNLGTTGRLGVDSQVTRDLGLYSTAELRQDVYQGRRQVGTVGQRWKANRYLDAYTESQLSNGEVETGQTHIFGLRYAPTQRWDLNADYSLSRLSRDGQAAFNNRYYDRGLNGAWIPQQGFGPSGQVQRDVLGLGLGYAQDHLKLRFSHQTRWDSGASDLLQNVFAGRAEADLDQQFSVLGRLDLGLTQPRSGGVDQARYTRGTLGLAYRPWEQDAANALAKFSYIEELAPVDQAFAGYLDERAYVASLDLTLGLGKYFELQPRVAYKQGEIRLQRGQGPWLSDRHTLGILRLNYHLLHRWDVLAEYRVLIGELSQSREQGWLLGFTLQVQRHLDLGAGYNFTDFNDDLTAMSYRARGPYVTVTGKW